MSFTIQEQLFRAAITGNAQDMSNLLLQKPELNIHNNTGMSLLYAAATYQREEVVSQLLAAGADSNIQNWTGTCSLHTAVIKNSNRILEDLLKYGANINQQDRYGMTPLHMVATRRGLERIKFLLDHGADVNKVNNQGETVLLITAECQDDQIVKYLVEHQEQYGVLTNHVDIENTSIMHYYNDNPKMQRFLFENGVVPSSATDVNNLQNITHDAQSVHATPAVKQMKFYIQELKNTFSNQDIRELTNEFNLSKELKQLFNFGANSKNIELLSLPKSEKEDLFKPIFDNTQDNQTKEHYQALLESNNADFAKEIISKSVVALDKWLERDAQGNYKHGKALATMQYDYSNDEHGKVTLPETLSMIRWLIDQNPTLEEKKELLATFCDINRHLVQSNLSQIRAYYPKIKEQDFVNKTSVHQLLSQLDDQTVSTLYNVVSNEDIETVLKEQKLFTLAKGIYVASIAYGEDREACFGGAMQQIVATVGEISPTIMNKYTEYLDEENKRNANQVNIDGNNVLSVVEVMSDTLIGQVQDKPDVALMLSEATLRVKESLESIPILDPNSITLEQQKLLSPVHRAFLSDVKKALPNYARDIPTREELVLVVSSLDQSPKLQQWSLSYEEPTQNKRKSDEQVPQTSKKLKTDNLSAVERL
ncbi:ankyrin repeat domain-containing protein, partial [Rickettsia sp. TH2014]|uniref:ankyrin repeat domain-containing protein n=1 Tax=Rickettsia sp. TH2014 TaxID=1967503 RepID=UPI001C43D6C0